MFAVWRRCTTTGGFAAGAGASTASTASSILCEMCLIRARTSFLGMSFLGGMLHRSRGPRLRPSFCKIPSREKGRGTAHRAARQSFVARVLFEDAWRLSARLPDHPAKWIADLLPWNWLTKHRAAA